MFFPCGAGAIVHGVSQEKKKEKKCIRKTVVIVVNLNFSCPNSFKLWILGLMLSTFHPYEIVGSN